MPPKSIATPKKVAQAQGKAKWSPPAGPMMNTSKGKWAQKVYTASTEADGIFVTWSSKPSGLEGSYVKPFKNYYLKEVADLELDKKWKIHGIYSRRDRKDLAANKVLQGSHNASYGWDCFVTAAEDGTAKSIGKHITKALNEFAQQAEEFKAQKHKPEYIFCGDVSEANSSGLKPLSHFLLDQDVAEVVKYVFENGNEKNAVMNQDDLLESFFGSAEKGREMLEDCPWRGST
ncbi:MAG: hypothetical protein OEY67_09680 [Gammaproteobacteria bacterium]|jgi:hypothetical protein|nr:hypothetical protein [Gammaproteobacteria bacterium]